VGGAAAGALAGNLDHLSGCKPARVRHLVVLREDVEAEAVSQVLLRELRQRIVALHRVAEELRAELLLRIGTDLIRHLARDVVGGIQSLRLREQLARGRFIAVLQLVDGFEGKLLRLCFRLCRRELRRCRCGGDGCCFGGAGAGAAAGVGGGVAHPAASTAIATIIVAHASIALTRIAFMCFLPFVVVRFAGRGSAEHDYHRWRVDFALNACRCQPRH
jgi:hypothetical protein